MSVEFSQLGKETEYPTAYAPQILYPISRQLARENYADIQGIQQGTDWWHIFEISWLDLDGKPCVAIGRLHIPANSPNLIESKSLKLYFNSFNFERLSEQDFISTVEKDLSTVAQADVKIQLFNVDTLKVSQPQGILLDSLDLKGTSSHPDKTLLSFDSNQQGIVEETYYSHLLRSNCPVTNQPDWGTVFVRYRGEKPCEKSLLTYIISYRQHNGFHEQCVEQIFADIWTVLNPEKLMVYAAYTRRGGLDINPCRVSDLSWMPAPIRLARQ